MGQDADADVLDFVLSSFGVPRDFAEPLRVPGGFVGLPVGTVKVALKEREGPLVALVVDPPISAFYGYLYFGMFST